MSKPNPEHLLDQATRLITPLQVGARRQVDLRRAISSAYYAVFHALLGELADEFVGASQRNSNRYALVYRSVDHARLRQLCQDLARARLPQKYDSYTPTGGFGADVEAFAVTFIELQDKRHEADYDPSAHFRADDALLTVRIAREALRRLGRASAQQRKALLTLLAFPPRR